MENSIVSLFGITATPHEHSFVPKHRILDNMFNNLFCRTPPQTPENTKAPYTFSEESIGDQGFPSQKVYHVDGVPVSRRNRGIAAISSGGSSTISNGVIGSAELYSVKSLLAKEILLGKIWITF